VCDNGTDGGRERTLAQVAADRGRSRCGDAAGGDERGKAGDCATAVGSDDFNAQFGFCDDGGEPTLRSASIDSLRGLIRVRQESWG
jgi:hypothetical protein